MTISKKFVWGCLAALALATSVNAQQAPSFSPNTDKNQATVLVWIGCEGTNCAGLTVDATAGGVTLTATQYAPVTTGAPAFVTRAQVAICSNSGAKIWVTPSSTITLSSGKGQPVLDGGQFTVYYYANIAKIHAIRDAAVSSTLYCDYYRQP